MLVLVYSMANLNINCTKDQTENTLSNILLYKSMKSFHKRLHVDNQLESKSVTLHHHNIVLLHSTKIWSLFFAL